MQKMVLIGCIWALAAAGASAQGLRVNDTDFSKGRLGHEQIIDIDDLAKFHGHLCDGLLEGFLALRHGLYKLFPDSVIDRTNLRVASLPSPCLTDAAIYLSGSRYQYGSFYVSDALEGMYIAQRIDNGQAVRISRKPNVKPAIIDELGREAVAGKLSPCELDRLRELEDAYTRFLRESRPEDLFEATPLPNFVWRPVLKNDFAKTDILNKNAERCRN